MSTRIEDAYVHGDSVQIDRYADDEIAICAHEAEDWSTVNVKPADFIAAVEAECDGIFIPRAELPEVIVDREWIEVDGQTFAATIQQGMNPDGIRAAYLRNLAAFEYLKAHPPVDEEQVEALATSFAEVAESDGGCKDGWNATIIARRLIAAGWSK